MGSHHSTSCHDSRVTFHWPGHSIAENASARLTWLASLCKPGGCSYQKSDRLIHAKSSRRKHCISHTNARALRHRIVALILQLTGPRRGQARVTRDSVISAAIPAPRTDAHQPTFIVSRIPLSFCHFGSGGLARMCSVVVPRQISANLHFQAFKFFSTVGRLLSGQ